MDEPLSNLDAKLRIQIRTELIELYQKLKTTFLYVTHDQVEAMSMATKIILLHKGKIQQIGTPMEVYDKPKNIYTAKFIGSPPMNIIIKDTINTQYKFAPEETVFLGFRPEKASFKPENETINIKGRIIAKELLGDQILYKINIGDETIQIKTFNEEVMKDEDCTVYVKKSDLHFFDRNEMRID